MRALPYSFFIILYYLVRVLLVMSSNRTFYISFLNVGQGDSFVINSPRYGAVMVDTGFDYQANYMSARYAAFPVCHIKSVFITHYDSDHRGGLDRILRYCPNIKVEDNLSAGDFLTFGGASLEVLSPARKNSSHEDNDDSIVMLLSYGKFRSLLTGDAGVSILRKVLSDFTGHLDVYKVSHHGSKHNTDTGLVSKLKPKVCVVSVGKNNFGHPSQDILNILRLSGCKVYRTDIDGTVVLY